MEGLRLWIGVFRIARDATVLGIALISMEGLRLTASSSDQPQHGIPRNCPDQYGGIATSRPVMISGGTLVDLGIALISMEGLRHRTIPLPEIIGRVLGIALISMEGLRLLPVIGDPRGVDSQLGIALISMEGLRLAYFAPDAGAGVAVLGIALISMEGLRLLR